MIERNKPSTGGAMTSMDFGASGTDAGDQPRGEPRTRCNKQIAILPCASERNWSFRIVTLLDCSPRGLGLRSEQSMQLGDQFLAKLQLERLTMVLYTVRHCTTTGPRQFYIGAEFIGVVGSPNDSDASAALKVLMDAGQ
jgi:hypothetical protein